MSSLSKRVDQLLELTRGVVDGKHLQQALQRILNSSRGAKQEELSSALSVLGSLIASGPLVPVALVACCAGGLVENGGDARIVCGSILKRTLDALQEYAAAGDGSQGPSALELIVNATNTVLMRSAEARSAARNDAVFMEALQSCSMQGPVEHLRYLARVLENEELVVLEPALQRGYRIRINGIGDNFQLHTLLADALIGDPDKGWLPGERPDPRVVAAAKDGPCPHSRNFPVARGSFNLWNWQGLQADGTLSAGGTDFWIWNEGNPADIAHLEGTRVILLGPPPYVRTWNAGRRFPAMPGQLEVLQTLPEAQVHDWLARIRSAVAKLPAS